MMLWPSPSVGECIAIVTVIVTIGLVSAVIKTWWEEIQREKKRKRDKERRRSEIKRGSDERSI